MSEIARHAWTGELLLGFFEVTYTCLPIQWVPGGFFFFNLRWCGCQILGAVTFQHLHPVLCRTSILYIQTDGASACLLMSEDKAKELGFKPKAYLRWAGSEITDRLLPWCVSYKLIWIFNFIASHVVLCVVQLTHFVLSPKKISFPPEH